MRFVFDSSSLIALSQSCLIELLPGLKEKTGSEFFISRRVFEEVVSRPLNIKRFELNAIRVKKAVDSGAFSLRDLPDEKAFGEISLIANSCFFSGNRRIELLHGGEIESLALALQLDAKAIVIDERTTRMLVEAPERLMQLLRERRREKISMQNENIKRMSGLFSGFNFVRSVELIALAGQYGLLQQVLPPGKQSLEAALYAVKYNGCAVSSREIDLFLRGI